MKIYGKYLKYNLLYLYKFIIYKMIVPISRLLFSLIFLYIGFNLYKNPNNYESKYYNNRIANW